MQDPKSNRRGGNTFLTFHGEGRLLGVFLWKGGSVPPTGRSADSLASGGGGWGVTVLGPPSSIGKSQPLSERLGVCAFGVLSVGITMRRRHIQMSGMNKMTDGNAVLKQIAMEAPL